VLFLGCYLLCDYLRQHYCCHGVLMPTMVDLLVCLLFLLRLSKLGSSLHWSLLLLSGLVWWCMF